MTRSQSTPASSQIIWLEVRVKQLEAERDKLKAALDAATAFIDCHAADPDITAEMRIKYAKYQKALKESA